MTHATAQQVLAGKQIVRRAAGVGLPSVTLTQSAQAQATGPVS